MKIWQLIESYPPDYGGGAALAGRAIAQTLAERGHDVRVLTTELRDAPEFSIRSEEDGRVRVDRVNLPACFRLKDPDGWTVGARQWGRYQEEVARLLGDQISSWRPDVAHYHTVRPFGEAGILGITERGVPVVATLHDAWLVCPRMYLLNSPSGQPCPGPAPLRCLECVYSHYDGSHVRSLAKLPWRLLKLGTFPAMRLRSRARAAASISGAMPCAAFLGPPHAGRVGGPIRHIRLGIDVEGMPVDRPARPRTPLRFGFVGGFQSHKGIADVIAASTTLVQRTRAFELHVWGPGQDSREAKQAEEQLAGRIRLRGMYTREERWDVYREVDVVVMATTVCEPFPLVMQEAEASGVPTIAPAVGGFCEKITHGVDGLLYQFRCPEDLARQMDRVLTEPELLDRLIGSQKPPLDASAAVNDIENFYTEVLSGRA